MLEKLLKKIQQEIASLKRRFQIKYTDANLSGDAECCQVFGINSTNGNLYYKDDNGQWVLKTVGSGGGFFDAVVDFSVNTDPNTIGTTFSPNSPALTTVIYVSTIDNSQWTYNGTNYVTYNAPFWTIRGNTGTTPGTDFIGTIDNKSLIFKTNNIKSGHIDILNISTSFGYEALLVNTSINNVAFGTGALKANTIGGGNTAIGKSALLANISGMTNIAVGVESLRFNTLGSSNVAVGRGSLYNTTSSGNVAIGDLSLNNNSTGSQNVAIGSEAGLFNTTASKQIFINSLNRVNYTGDQTQSPIYIQQDALVQNQKIFLNGLMNIAFVPTYTDNTAALVGGLVAGNIYKISIGGGTFNLAVVV